MIWPLVIYGLIVLALLVAELREDARAQRFFKPLAALGFVLLAIYCGALDSTYGMIILAGLVACAAGDVFLLSRNSEKLFMAGMGAFALGHILYTVSFRMLQSGSFSIAILAMGPIAIIAGLVFYIWLRPKLPPSMKLPVLIYTIIIIMMVIRSLGIPFEGWLRLAPIAAIMFAVSDMFVARDRFVARDSKNTLAITPLYFGAQALFALSAQI